VAAGYARGRSSVARAPQPDRQSQAPPPGDESQTPYASLSPEQLQRLVAPIALYPDSLVAQILAASTFPSQIVEADNWVKAHQGMSPQELGAQADQQEWDPSVKALVQFPSVLNNLASNLGWTSELGDAYYNQQQDVMNAVQVMRQQAQSAGNLNSTPQENVQNENGQIEIQPTNPEVIYVPAYNPWVVYGYPITPWPYWVDVPGVWWGGPGLSFGFGFNVAPFFGFGWGWHAWGMDWYHHGIFFNRGPYFAHGPDFFERRGFYGGRGDWGRAGGLRGWGYRGGGYRGGGYRGGGVRGGAFRGGGVRGGSAYRGFQAPRGASGLRSGPFTGFNHGGISRGFSARGQRSMGGFHGGGFRGGSFHGGGGFRGGGGRHR
jgi:hypothetical protein